MGNNHTLPIKSWVGHVYSLVPVGMPIPFPFTLTCESMWSCHHVAHQLLLPYVTSMRDKVISKSWYFFMDYLLLSLGWVIFWPFFLTDECKIVNIMCNIWSTHRVPNGYGYLLGMGMCEVSYPWVWVWVEFCTYQLYEYGYGIALPCPYPIHCHL
jgi:hypothetical protein